MYSCIYTFFIFKKLYLATLALPPFPKLMDFNPLQVKNCHLMVTCLASEGNPKGNRTVNPLSISLSPSLLMSLSQHHW
ncbi:hypothetical protein Scep_021454 [Stephania cephalantha]|uniref:Uncharacterized protein n=1 Tax=Stephania cephalantha TaxID=152367 RepID=A0AAP0I1H8_9MAGN